MVNPQKTIELLAPAQNLQTGISAVNYGADAVYIGASSFGARKNAGNSIFDIEKLINHAHKYNAKVYIALNTILDDFELKKAQKLAFDLYNAGADAFIIQDMGLLELDLPDVELHASTQCNIRTLEKVKFIENLGFSRAILARELSFDKIKEIKENTNIDLEVFIHGALCTSYSGQCYMSASIGERSANRGDCAQACRKKYSLIQNNKIIQNNKHLLSLKDFCAKDYLDKLVSIGVKSFKIEGRLKDENYVKNVVLYYAKMLEKYKTISDGKIYSDFEPNIEKTFNRGYTTYFLSGKRKKIANFDTPKSTGELLGNVIEFKNNILKIDTDKKINPQDGLCYLQNGELSGFIVNKIENNKIYPNKKVQISIGDKIFRNKDTQFENIIQNSKTKRLIDADITVLENKIVFEDEKYKTEIDFEGEIANDIKKAKESFIRAFSKTGEGIFKVKNINFKTENISYLPISKLNELRRILFSTLERIRLKNYKRNKGNKITPVQYKENIKDYRLNIHNNKAEEFYKKCGIEKVEYSPEKTRNFKNKELMRTKYCIRYEINKCLKEGANPTPLFLKDEKGEIFPLIFDCKNCEMVILKN